MDNELLVKSIKKLCQKRNISVSQLENKLGFSPSLISRWKDKTPSLDKIVDIADYFQVSLDETVGRNQTPKDEFVKLLYEGTCNGTLDWMPLDEEHNELYGNNIEVYHEYDDDELEANNLYEQTYFIEYNNGYILMYANYFYSKIVSPESIKLLIQVSDNSPIMVQNNTYEELLPLWIKILNSLDTIFAPDEIRAEDFKTDFIDNKRTILDKKTNNYNDIKKAYDVFQNNKKLLDMINKLNTPEVQKLQKMFSDPSFREMAAQASKLATMFKDFK